MKTVLHTLFLITFAFQSFAQLVAYDPENAVFNWWTEGIQLDEVGEGAIAKLDVRVDIEGQLAKIQFAFELKALPDAAHIGGDNDSLELRTSFIMPEDLVFTGIHMRMNGEMRHGRIIERSKAEVIYDNIVFGGDNVPSDPGLLMKDGDEYEFRVFPAGVDKGDYAFVILDAVIALNSFNSVSKQTRIPLSLFQQSTTPIDSFSMTLKTSNHFSNAQMTGLSGVNWQTNSDSSRTCYFQQIDLPSYLQFELVNQYVHQQNQSNSDLNDRIYSMWSVPFDQTLNRPACNYMIVVDIDFANKRLNEADEVLIEAVDRALAGIQAQMEVGDLFYLIVNGEFFLSYSNQWVPMEGFESARSFALEQTGLKTNILSSLEQAHFLMQGVDGQIIILTNDYFEEENQSDQALRIMANNILATTAKSRTDIYNFHSGPNTVQAYIAGEYRNVTQAFFTEACEITQGYYRAFSAQNESLAVQQMAASRLSIESIEADSFYTDRFYFQFPSESEMHVYSESDDVFVPTAFSVNYSNGLSTELKLSNLQLTEVDTCLRSLLGSAIIKTNETTYQSQYLISRDYEKISTDYLLLSDYSSLLVVENDSQYNDTVPRTIIGWPPMPLTNETVTEELSELSCYPNPATSFVNISLASKTDFIESIQVFDVSGKLLLDKAFGGFQTEIQLNELDAYPTGLYFLKIRTNQNRTFDERILLN